MAYVRVPEDDSALGSLGCGPGCSCGGCRQSAGRLSGLSERYEREEEESLPPEPAAPVRAAPRAPNLNGWGRFGEPLPRRNVPAGNGLQLRMPAFETITGFPNGRASLSSAQVESVQRAAEFIARSWPGAAPVTSVRVTGYIDAHESQSDLGRQRAAAVRDALLHRLNSLRPGLAARLRWITEDRGLADVAKVEIYLWVEQKKWQQDQVDARLKGLRDERGLTISPMNLGEGQSAGACSGWESDKESFSKRVAELYMRTVLGQPLRAKSIRQGSQARWEVRFSDRIVIAVVFGQGFVAAARMGTPLGPVRHYNYFCTATGDLVLTDRPLPSHP